MKMPAPCCAFSAAYAKWAVECEDCNPGAPVIVLRDSSAPTTSPLGIAVPLKHCPNCGVRLEVVGDELRVASGVVLELMP